MNNSFKIALWNVENEEWKTLESHSSYDDADDRYDYWSNKYPHAYIEILDPLF
jgi:hypothetical protein